MLAQSRKRFYDTNVGKLTSKKAVAFTAVKALKAVDYPEPWQPTHLRPGSTVEEVGEEMADFFARISTEFQPLKTENVPTTYDDSSAPLTDSDVEKELRSMTLPKSYVTFDPPPQIIGPCAGTFAKIMRPIMNRIGHSFWWPSKWKSKEVTVIPKMKLPDHFNQCQNISCTSVFSKLAEVFMVKKIRAEISLADNQYGGNVGMGTNHLLCDLTTAMMEDLDDG